ncbi:anti-sigma factor [Litoribacter populi]|uniref:anti-sigma factor n=1 Tax=Litoribacter populi TaxID=2598460 RepID=UPI0029391BBD|nr:anti-sigma factor [Litoribacter populi]
MKGYISSGILELYLLGELSERERQEVEQMAARYPEIREELDQLEASMFAFDRLSGQKPSPAIKDKIFASLEVETPPASIKTMDTPESKALSRWRNFSAAAAVVALLATVFAFYFANRYYSTQEEYRTLVLERSVLAEELEINQARYEQMEEFLGGDFDRIPLEGEAYEMQKDAQVDIFWDRNDARVFASVRNLQLLEPGQDYQLWAIGEDGPIGIGIINASQTGLLQQMETVSAAGAFAITIEPKGGSQTPTLENLVVLGEVV